MKLNLGTLFLVSAIIFYWGSIGDSFAMSGPSPKPYANKTAFCMGYLERAQTLARDFKNPDPELYLSPLEDFLMQAEARLSMKVMMLGGDSDDPASHKIGVEYADTALTKEVIRGDYMKEGFAPFEEMVNCYNHNPNP